MNESVEVNRQRLHSILEECINSDIISSISIQTINNALYKVPYHIRISIASQIGLKYYNHKNYNNFIMYMLSYSKGSSLIPSSVYEHINIISSGRLNNYHFDQIVFHSLAIASK